MTTPTPEEVKAAAEAKKTERAAKAEAKRQEQEALKAARAAEREAKKAEAAAKKAAEKAEREAEKERRAAEKAANQMPIQNDIRRPRPGTQCAQLWDAYDSASTEKQAPVAIGDIMEHLLSQGFNPATIRTQYARWRQFHGVTGRIESSVAAEAKAAREAEKARKAAEAAEAKAKREAEKAAALAEKAAAKAAAKAEAAAAEAQ